MSSSIVQDFNAAELSTSNDDQIHRGAVAQHDEIYPPSQSALGVRSSNKSRNNSPDDDNPYSTAPPTPEPQRSGPPNPIELRNATDTLKVLYEHDNKLVDQITKLKARTADIRAKTTALRTTVLAQKSLRERVEKYVEYWRPGAPEWNLEEIFAGRPLRASIKGDRLRFLRDDEDDEPIPPPLPGSLPTLVRGPDGAFPSVKDHLAKYSHLLPGGRSESFPKDAPSSEVEFQDPPAPPNLAQVTSLSADNEDHPVPPAHTGANSTSYPLPTVQSKPLQNPRKRRRDTTEDAKDSRAPEARRSPKRRNVATSTPPEFKQDQQSIVSSDSASDTEHVRVMLSAGVAEDVDKEAMEEEDSVVPLPVVERGAKTRKQRSVSRSRNGEKLVNKRGTRAPG